MRSSSVSGSSPFLANNGRPGHVATSLYQAFPAAEARRIAERFEWHYTPKHGSWLNMAEAELSVLARQCLAYAIARDP